MKTLKLSLFASAMMLGSFAVNAQSADEIIGKHIAAIGGDSWNKITSMKTISTMSVQGMEIEMTEVKAKGKGMRMDMNAMGTENYMIVTPTAGWSYMPAQGATKVEALTEEQVKMSQSQAAIIDDLVTYKQDGLKAEYSGKEDVNGKPAHKVTLTDKDGNKTIAFFDATTYYKVKETMAAQGQELSTDYSEFKKFPEGVVIAMKSANAYAETTIKTVEFNKPVDDKIFKPAN